MCAGTACLCLCAWELPLNGVARLQNTTLDRATHLCVCRGPEFIVNPELVGAKADVYSVGVIMWILQVGAEITSLCLGSVFI